MIQNRFKKFRHSLPNIHRKVKHKLDLDPRHIQNIENPSYKIKLYAILKNPIVIQHIEYNETLYRIAVTSDPNVLQYIEVQSEKICLYAIKKNVHTIKFVKNKTPLIWKKALQYDGTYIQHIKNPNYELQTISLKSRGVALQYIKNQTLELIELAIKSDVNAYQYTNIPVTSQWELNMIKKNYNLIPYVKTYTENIKNYVVNNLAYWYRFLKNTTYEQDVIAVKNNRLNIKYVKKQTEELALLSISSSSHNLLFIKNPSKKVLLTAIDKDVTIFKHVNTFKNLDSDIWIKIIKKDPSLINFIKIPPQKRSKALIKLLFKNQI